MTQELVINEVMPGLNGSDGLIAENRWKKKQRQEHCICLIRSCNPKRHAGKVSIEYTRSSVNTMDWDNLAASFKHWGDALVKCGVIIDDNPKVVVRFTPIWEKAKNNDSVRTVIKIEGLE